MRAVKFSDELAVTCGCLKQRLIHEYEERIARITSWSTLGIQKLTFSVPTILMGEKVNHSLLRKPRWFSNCRSHEDSFTVAIGKVCYERCVVKSSPFRDFSSTLLEITLFRSVLWLISQPQITSPPLIRFSGGQYIGLDQRVDSGIDE